MFTKDHRLDRLSFTTTYTHGKKLHMPSFLFVYAPSPVQRVAVVVGKKVEKSAVARNRLKRRLYGAVYETNLKSGHSIIIAKPKAATASYEELMAEIATAVTRALGRTADSR